MADILDKAEDKTIEIEVAKEQGDDEKADIIDVEQEKPVDDEVVVHRFSQKLRY